MHKLVNAVTDFLRDEDGLTMVEYAIAGGLIAAAGAGTFILVGNNVDAVMQNIDGVLTQAAGA